MGYNDYIMKKYSWCNADSAIVVLRLGVGLVFIYTGWMKVANLSGTASFFATLGFSAFWAYLVSFVELIGGIAIILGVYTRVAAMLLVITMIVATFILRHNIGQAIAPFMTLFASLAIALAGSKKCAVMKGE